MRPAIGCCLAAAALACGPASAPTLPEGPLAAIAVDGEHALVVVEQGRQDTLALLDAAGAPLWTAPVTTDDQSWLFDRKQQIVGEHLLGLYGHVTVSARADGRVLARRPSLPASLAQRLDAPEPLAFDLVDGVVRSHVQGRSGTWFTAYDPVADRELWQIGRPPFTDTLDLGVTSVLGLRIGEPQPRVFGAEGQHRSGQDIFEVIDARTGARRARLTGVRHCVADGTLFVVDADLRVTAVDLEDPAPRTVTARLSLPPTRRDWYLESCHHHGGDAWLEFTDEDATLVVGIDRTQGQRRVGLCDDSAAGPLPGRWLVVHPPALGGTFAVHDVELGRLAWVQDRAIDPTHYTSKYNVGDVLYLRGLVGGPGASGEIWRLMAIDRRSGEIVGAAAITGPGELDMSDIRDGQMWLFGREVSRRGAVPLVRLDARTLRPRGPLPRGLDVVDTTGEALAARRAPTEHQPGVTWDPAAPGDPRLRCRTPGDDPDDREADARARERAP